MRKLCVHRKHSAGSAVPVNTEYCAATFELPLFVFHQTIFTLYVLILASVCVCMCSPLVSSVSISPCVYVSLSFGIHKENTVITLCSCGSNNNIILLFFRLLLLLLLLPLVCCLAFHIACMSIISSNEKKERKPFSRRETVRSVCCSSACDVCAAVVCTAIIICLRLQNIHSGVDCRREKTYKVFYISFAFSPTKEYKLLRADFWEKFLLCERKWRTRTGKRCFVFYLCQFGEGLVCFVTR